MAYQHIEEQFFNLNDIIPEVLADRPIVRKPVQDLLSNYYEWNDESEEFDDTTKDGYTKYSIEVKTVDEMDEDDFITISYITVYLPDDDAAKELADLLDGRVTSGLKGGKKYTVVYTKVITVRARNLKEANSAVKAMADNERDSAAGFGKIVSVHPGKK